MFIVLMNCIVDEYSREPTYFYKGEGLCLCNNRASFFSSRKQARGAIKETEKIRGERLKEKYGFTATYEIVELKEFVAAPAAER